MDWLIDCKWVLPSTFNLTKICRMHWNAIIVQCICTVEPLTEQDRTVVRNGRSKRLNERENVTEQLIRHSTICWWIIHFDGPVSTAGHPRARSAVTSLYELHSDPPLLMRRLRLHLCLKNEDYTHRSTVFWLETKRLVCTADSNHPKCFSSTWSYSKIPSLHIFHLITRVFVFLCGFSMFLRSFSCFCVVFLWFRVIFLCFCVVFVWFCLVFLWFRVVFWISHWCFFKFGNEKISFRTVSWKKNGKKIEKFFSDFRMWSVSVSAVIYGPDCKISDRHLLEISVTLISKRDMNGGTKRLLTGSNDHKTMTLWQVRQRLNLFWSKGEPQHLLETTSPAIQYPWHLYTLPSVSFLHKISHLF